MFGLRGPAGDGEDAPRAGTGRSGGRAVLLLLRVRLRGALRLDDSDRKVRTLQKVAGGGPTSTMDGRLSECWLFHYLLILTLGFHTTTFSLYHLW